MNNTGYPVVEVLLAFSEKWNDQFDTIGKSVRQTEPQAGRPRAKSSIVANDPTLPYPFSVSCSGRRYV